MKRFRIIATVLFLILFLIPLAPANAQTQATPPAAASSVSASSPAIASAEKPRVFITDSQSWEVTGSAGGSNGSWGAHSSGGARPQTAEIIKTFGERCPQVVVNNKLDIAEYVVVLDHEGGKGYLRHRNKVAVFDRLSGDAVVSHSTLSLGGSVQDACEGISKHWAAHATELRAAAARQSAPAPTASAAPDLLSKGTAVSRVSVSSVPDAADIEIDGSFVGNTPSAVELPAGEHQVSVKKLGYKPWGRKLKVSGGDIKLNAELEKE